MVPLQAGRGHQRQGFELGGKALAFAADAQAFEGAVVLGAPARGEAQQSLVAIHFGRHVAAGAAQQHLLYLGIAAQEGGGRRVKHAQAFEQAVGRVSGAGLLGAVERDLGQGSNAVILGHAGQRNAFHHGADRQFGRVGGQVGHGKGRAGTAQQ